MSKVILGFHMPLFFILSGLVARTSIKSNTTFGVFLIKKAKTLLIPQITLGIISYIYYVLFTVVMKGGRIGDVNFIYQFWRYWFLQVLFVVSIVFYMISLIFNLDRKKNQIIAIGVSLLLGFFFCYGIHWPDESPFYINVVPFAFAFYMGGHVLKPILTAWPCCMSSARKNVIGMVCVVVLILSTYLNEPVTMYNNGYGIFTLFLLSALSGSYLVWACADLLKNNKFIRWCGENSIVIYVWQFSITQFMKNIIEIICDKLSPNCPQGIMTALVFASCLVAIVPAAVVSNKVVPELFGKKRH